nr:glycosyltransferase [Microvirga terrestris]
MDPWPADRPLVSVVIPCFNYGHFVAESVESVLAQTFQDLEIIVVEGGSSSLESRQQLAEMVFPRTRILLQSEAHRAGANRNFGISQARGKYICCLDADDRIDPTYIEKAVFLIEHFGYDVVSTAVEFFGNRTGGYGSLERPVLKDMLQANYIPTCAVFKRDLWDRVGGFRDSDLNTGHVHEDWLFWVRAAALGARFWNIVGERLFKYRIHGNSLSNGQDVLPIEHQRTIVRELNADVLGPEVIGHSYELAVQNWRHPEPLRNLTRFGRDIADDRPTMLLALPFLIIGGAERLLSAITGHLSSVGWRVIIVTTVQVGPEHGDTTDWFRGATSEIYHLPRFLGQERWNDFINFLIQTKRIDLLWIVGSAAFYDRLQWLKELYPKLKVVDLLFNTVGHTANNRKHANLIDLNLVENQEVYGWLVEQGEAQDRIRKIESGLDLERYSPRPKSQEILNELGISEDTVLIGFSGRWSEEKDPLGFIEIAKLVPEDVPVAFVMTGAGPLTKKVEAAVTEANFAPKRFHLMGAVPDVTPYIASYDLLCLPSLLDGRPVVVLEALALGIPVLASRVGALPDLVQDAVSGRLCAPGDYPAFAAQIAALVRNPSQLQKMKQQARLAAEQKFDARNMLTAYDEALRGVLVGDAAGKSFEDGDGASKAGSGEYFPENSAGE